MAAPCGVSRTSEEECLALPGDLISKLFLLGQVKAFYTSVKGYNLKG